MPSDFVIDDDKNLFYKNKFIQKLRKNIYKIVDDGEFYFILDSFGDCFRVRVSEIDEVVESVERNTGDNLLEFIFGILGMPKYFDIFYGSLVVRDNFNRIFIYTHTGQLTRVLHFKDIMTDITIDKKLTIRFEDNDEPAEFDQSIIMNEI